MTFFNAERIPFPRALLCFAAIALLQIAPLLWVFASGIVDSTDLHFYAMSGVEFARQFRGGDLYPRWLTELNAGLGAPVFYFYPPLAYYIGALLPIPFDADSTGVFRLAAGMGLSVFVSAVTCYFWLARSLHAKHALLGAIIYILIPYRLFYLYLDFNLAQCWALAWYPLMLLCAERLAARKRHGLPAYAASFALLALTHLPSAMVFALLPVAYAMVIQERGKRFGTMLRMLAASIHGAALAAIFLWPMLENTQVMNVESFTQGKFSYENNFFTWQALDIGLLRHGAASYVDFIQGVLLLMLPVLLWYVARTLPREAWAHQRKTRLFWIATAIGAMFMMTSLSGFLWANVPLLANLQFPIIRFYSVVCVALTVLVLWRITYGRLRLSGKLLLGIFAALHVVIIVLSYGWVEGWPKPRAGEAAETMRVVHDTRIIVQREYQGEWTDESVHSLESMREAMEHKNQRAILQSGEGTVDVTDWKSNVIRFKADITSDSAQVVLRRFYFTGWQGEDRLVGTYPSGFYGMLAFSLNKGAHEVTLRLEPVGTLEGTLTSLAALLLLAAQIIFANRFANRA